ncbi:MAG: helix-turn-helix domain-containing protein [Clostridia bacterium]|nr:helix-turn-helix domain-containing protein [Clostridia bacterium]
MTIGEKIKEKRKELNLTQRELSNHANISETALINYEKNKRTPSLEILEKIASALGTNAFSLVDDKYIDKKYTNFKNAEIECYAFIYYLNSLGYTVTKLNNPTEYPNEFITNISETDNKKDITIGEHYNIEIIKDSKKITLEENEFISLQNDTKEIIEYKLWQKLNHNQSN